MSEENSQEIVKDTENVKKSFDWAKLSGFITAGVIVLVMLILNWCGCVKINNIEEACKYTKESVKIASMGYFQVSKDQYTPVEAQEIVDSVLLSIKTTTDQLNAGKIEFTEAKAMVITEVDKIIDAKAKKPEIAKKIAHTLIEGGFSSIETYSSGVIKDSGDYVKLMNSISEGIQEGYKIVYPEAKCTTAMITYNSCFVIA